MGWGAGGAGGTSGTAVARSTVPFVAETRDNDPEKKRPPWSSMMIVRPEAGKITGTFESPSKPVVQTAVVISVFPFKWELRTFKHSLNITAKCNY